MEQLILKNKIRYPKYARYDSRLVTFNKASHDSFLYSSKSEFADAGFFYTGRDDRTICYYCGGGLKDWENTDDAWEQHARWFDRCPYVLVKKGKEFVEQHRNKPKCHLIEVGEEALEDSNIITEGKECIICLSSEKNLLFLPCRHCYTCSSCGLMYNDCIICRTPITSLMKVFVV